MKNLSVVAGVAVLFSAGPALAQSLCNPCIDPPVDRPTNFSSAPGRSVITGEQMRDLGVVSVADMVNQLPGNFVRPDLSADEAAAANAGEAVESAGESVESGDKNIDASVE